MGEFPYLPGGKEVEYVPQFLIHLGGRGAFRSKFAEDAVKKLKDNGVNVEILRSNNNGKTE